MVMPEPDTRKQRVIRDTLIGMIGGLSGASIETLYRGLGQVANGWTGLDERAVMDWLAKSIEVALRKHEEPEPEQVQRAETPAGIERRLFEIGGRRRR